MAASSPVLIAENFITRSAGIKIMDVRILYAPVMVYPESMGIRDTVQTVERRWLPGNCFAVDAGRRRDKSRRDCAQNAAHR